MIVIEDSESEFFHFIRSVITEFIAKELQPPAQPAEEADHLPRGTTYGQCRKPFGLVRIRAVEFLNEAYKVFTSKDIH